MIKNISFVLVKKVLAYIMLAIIMLVSFQQSIVVVHFKLNQSFIEANYCINKDKPQMNCHGKCYLEKELKDNQQDDVLVGLSLYETVVFVLLDNGLPTFDEVFYENSERKIISKDFFVLGDVFDQSFRPPISLAV
ncbi:hypothetical protein PG357_07060 [Riemerella anatipestifer]|nr:hypothetical protein [Riemerella anatipestifer]